MVKRKDSADVIRVGTRRSELARLQTDLVIAEIKKLHPNISFEVVGIITSGDRRQGTAEAGMGDKKEWVQELETALVSGEIDLAIHSGKDMPVQLVEGTKLYPVLERASPFDAIVTATALQPGPKLRGLAVGAKVGTASLRRRSQLRLLRPDLDIIECRGNVPTRLKKIADGSLSALVLAEAGLHRLNIETSRSMLSAKEMVPAMNQGILVAQFRETDTRMDSMIEAISPVRLRPAFFAEREVVRRIGADCRSAVGVYGNEDGDSLKISARVCSPDGTEMIEAAESGPSSDALDIGARIAEELLVAGARRLLFCDSR